MQALHTRESILTDEDFKNICDTCSINKVLGSLDATKLKQAIESNSLDTLTTCVLLEIASTFNKHYRKTLSRYIAAQEREDLLIELYGRIYVDRIFFTFGNKTLAFTSKQIQGCHLEHIVERQFPTLEMAYTDLFNGKKYTTTTIIIEEETCDENCGLLMHNILNNQHPPTLDDWLKLHNTADRLCHTTILQLCEENARNTYMKIFPVGMYKVKGVYAFEIVNARLAAFYCPTYWCSLYLSFIYHDEDKLLYMTLPEATDKVRAEAKRDRNTKAYKLGTMDMYHDFENQFGCYRVMRIEADSA
jgi:hypothetical protein